MADKLIFDPITEETYQKRIQVLGEAASKAYCALTSERDLGPEVTYEAVEEARVALADALVAWAGYSA